MNRFLLLLVYAMMFSGFSYATEQNSSMLKPCPDKPNCVSSLANSEQHKVTALSFQGNAEQVLGKIKTIIEDLPRTELISESSEYLHFTFTSLIFRFVDDVEFHLIADDNIVHVRSASRIGHSDLGANRKRVEKIRQLFEAVSSD